MMTKAPIRLAIVACLSLGSWSVAAQTGLAPDQHGNGGFRGIYWKRGGSDRPNAVQMTDGKTFATVSEQEYRESNYMPAFEQLPERIVQRLPARQKLEQ
jgi:hypothetical protein